jgi:hypothetical protein
MMRRALLQGLALAAGDGLRRPLGAPPAPTPGIGVQPGISAVTIANYVIVFGPVGTPVGVFVYQPGTTPAKGNPPIESLSGASADPFGNVILPGAVTYANTLSPPVATQVGGGLIARWYWNGSAWVIMFQETIGDAGTPLAVYGFQNSPVNAGYQVGNSLFQILGTLGTLNASGVLPINCPITATAGTAANPTQISTDTWHALTLPSTGVWAGTARYTLSPVANVAILDINVTFTTTAAAGSYNCQTDMGSVYQPTGSGTRQYDLAVNQTWSTEANASPRVAISGAGAATPGQVTFDMPAFVTAGNSAIVSGTIWYPTN